MRKHFCHVVRAVTYTNDGNIDLRRIFANVIANKGIGTDHIKCGNTANFLWVVNSFLCQNFSGNRHRTVDWITNDGQNCFGAKFRTSFNQCFDNSSICVEQVVTRHSRLTGDSSRNHNDRSTGQCLGQTIIASRRPSSGRWKMARNFRLCRDLN